MYIAFSFERFRVSWHSCFCFIW